MRSGQRIVVVLILFLGFLLKLHNYDKYPQRGATSDEYTYSFLGLSLLTKGIPISWSHFGVYPNREDVRINEIDFPLVWPYFDHPPLAGLFVGSWALLNGEHTFEQIKLSTIRLVPVALSVVSSLFVFLLTYRLTNYLTAIWALLIYSTVTIFVIQSRVVVAENFLTPIMLAALYYFQTIKKATRRNMIHLGIISVAAFWVKESGITLPIGLIALFLYKKIKISVLSTFLTTIVLGLGAYALYGWVYDWDTFVNIIRLQGNRNVGPQTLWYLLSTPIIINKIYYDGWYFFGFFALATLYSQIKRYVVVIIPPFVYFFFLLLSLTQRGQSGWYMIPLFPFMAIASAIVLKQAIKQTSATYLIFLFFIGFMFFESFFQARFGLTNSQFRTLSVLVFGPAVLVTFFRNTQRVRQRLYVFYFYVAIGLTAIGTYSYLHPA